MQNEQLQNDVKNIEAKYNADEEKLVKAEEDAFQKEWRDDVKEEKLMKEIDELKTSIESMKNDHANQLKTSIESMKEKHANQIVDLNTKAKENLKQMQ